MTRNLLIIVSVTAVMLTGTPAFADIIAEYKYDSMFFGTNGDESSVSTDTHAETTATQYTSRSNSMVPSGKSGIDPGFAYIYSSGTASTANPVISNGFHEFELQIDSGEWTLDNISFDYQIENTYAGGQFFAHVYTDVTDFSNVNDVIGSYTHTGAGGDTPIANVQIDLSRFREHQNLTAGDSVLFRLYFGDYTSSDQRIHKIDNVVIEANAVPEPGAIALILGSFALLATRRRR